MSSIKKNFSYNLILTFCNYLFPIFTFPYVSRVLGVNNIGIFSFVDGIVNYFVLFSALGIGSYGVREIAKFNGNREKIDIVFSNLFFLNIVFLAIALLVYICCIFYLDAFANYTSFLWIGIAKIIFSAFLLDWFFQGLQHFKYITTCSVVIKFFYVLAVFLFVKTEHDIYNYYVLTCFTVVVNSIVNWVHSSSLCSFYFKYISVKNFIIPVLAYGYYKIITSMYTSFNVVFLGFCSGDVEVGYFSTATKLYTVIMSVFTAFTTVMVPKVSELLYKKDYERLHDIADNTFSLLGVVSFPIIWFSLIFASDIVFILSGSGYEGACIPFRIVIFMLLIIGMEQIVIQQFLLATSGSKPIYILSTLGAVVGLSLNFVLTPKLGSVGSAISWGVSEFCVLNIGLYFLKKQIGFSLNLRKMGVDVLYSILYTIPLIIIYNCHLGQSLLTIIVSIISCSFVFLLLNIWIKPNPIIKSFYVTSVDKIRSFVG